jgi:hypothetical protein
MVPQHNIMTLIAILYLRLKHHCSVSAIGGSDNFNVAFIGTGNIMFGGSFMTYLAELIL